MLIHLLTLHPDLVQGPLEESILGRAREKGLIDVRVVNIRNFAGGPHQQADDYPYGGGAGLVLKPEPLFAAVEFAIKQGPYGHLVTPDTLVAPLSAPGLQVILMEPIGRTFDQAAATELARTEHLILVCGRYEGFDERIRRLASAEWSIGDYVLTGGELPALVIIDAVSRLIPGVLGDEHSAADDSFVTGLLEGPAYTRPPDFRGLAVPEVLLSGDHRRIAQWRRREALRRTQERRPELLDRMNLTDQDRAILADLEAARRGKGEGKGRR